MKNFWRKDRKRSAVVHFIPKHVKNDSKYPADVLRICVGEHYETRLWLNGNLMTTVTAYEVSQSINTGTTVRLTLQNPVLDMSGDTDAQII